MAKALVEADNQEAGLDLPEHMSGLRQRCSLGDKAAGPAAVVAAAADLLLASVMRGKLRVAAARAVLGVSRVQQEATARLSSNTSCNEDSHTTSRKVRAELD